MNYYERHIGDYLKATAHLSLLEHGIYSRLLDVYYAREAAIPEDQVARLVGARTDDEKEALAIVLKEFFVLDGGKWMQARCDRELERYADKQAKAKNSADARWNAVRNKSEGNANAIQTHSEGNAPQSPVTSNQTPVTIEDKKTRAEALKCPSDVEKQVWDDFLNIRRAKKSPVTNTALAGIQREADIAGVTLETALKTCCERGWVGFKAEWLASKTDAVETVYQKSMRLRVAEIAPELARAAPGAPNITDYFRTIDVSPLKTLEISQ